jgi:diguanylate cyclase (GGDEF)-like protein
VYNRGHLDEILEKEFRSAVVGGWPLSVVFADLDRFKLVNDTYGHPTGDSVLKATAQLLVGELRDEDVVARYGGEEFVIVLPGIGTESARNICDRLLARLRALQHEVAAGTTIRTTASLGLATHCAQSPFDGVGDLIKAADRCVYAAKEAGRDRVVCFKPELARTA